MAIKDLLTLIFYRQIMVRLLQTAFTTLLVLGFFTTAFSQTGSVSSDNDAIDANAEVQAYIDVTPGDNISYGTLTTGDDDGTISADQEGQAGNFTVAGTAGASISLSFSKSDLEHIDGTSGDGTRTIAINLNETDNGAWEDEPSSDFSSAGNNFNLESGTNADLPTSDGDITVWANPSITLTGSEIPGTYEGSVTLTAAYN